jgi:formiminotetrahydrofolate cyclodeaminase
MGRTPLARTELTELLDRVASTDPAPGAGPSTAWTCAVAAALVQMVSAIELRHDPSDGGGAAQRRDRAAALRDRALELAEHDVAAYGEVMGVFARRDEPGHGGRLREALSRAADPPAEMARVAGEVTALAADAAAVARGGVRGEALTAAVIAEAAVRAAVGIVEMNLAGSADDPRHAEVAALADAARADLARAQEPQRRRR